MKCPGCQQDNPSHAKFCLGCGTPFKRTHENDPPAASYTDLQHALIEALEQQTATSEILRVISSSPTDVQPVYDAIMRSAVTLCDAILATVYRREGDVVHLVAIQHPHAAEVAAAYPAPVTSSLMSCRAIRENAVIHLPDVETEGALPPEGLRLARLSGFRSVLSVPLRREGQAIGAFLIGRPAAGPFPAEQIALLQTFADQAVIAIDNVRLFKELEARNAELTETLARQTATGEVLRAISQAQTVVQPVFDIIASSARRLCGAAYAQVQLYDGELIHLAALQSVNPEGDAAIHAAYPLRVGDGSAGGRAIGTRAVAQIPDLLDEQAYKFKTVWEASGLRSLLAVPMLRESEAIGAIGVGRTAPGPFTDTQIELLKTFADQAVIAVENVRLFTELQASNRELTTALDTQTATSDILRVISRSQTDVQPVFDAIMTSAVSLLRAHTGALTRIAGEQIELAALTSVDDAGNAALRARFPQSLHSEDPHVQVIRARVPLNVNDAQTDPRWPEAARAYARIRGYRSAVAVPMLRHDEAIGSIGVNRREPGGFTDDEIALLQTFADQAVIAIENARLFSELQQRNRALTEAYARVTETLEQQIATSEILRVISSSPTDTLPVFETIAENAVRLCNSLFSAVYTFTDGLMWLVAHRNFSPDAVKAMETLYPARPGRETAAGRAILERTIIEITDVLADPAYGRDLQSRGGWRSTFAVPMLREGTPIGAIAVGWAEPGPASPGSITILQTFADQAVIAIENVRLFKELEASTADLTRSVEQLTALGEVGRAVSSTLDLETVLTTIVSRAVELSAMDGGVIFEYDEGEEAFIHRAATGQGGSLAEVRRAARIGKGEGVVGRTAITLEPEQVPDITVAGAYESRLRENLIASGVRAILVVPMVREDRLIGDLVVTRNRPGEFPSATIELLRTFATQSALAIQNARLFREIEIKSRELEVASQHKSEFLASMSHELRTPLNAIIGFSDVLLQGMFGETNEKQTEYLHDILASGQHLLSLINDILDLSKIEAGRMELDVAAFDIPTAIDDALLLMRERASRRGIMLERDVDKRVGEIRADQRKVKQVLLNLLSNAVKFTPEGGRIDVRAGLANGTVEISVRDTGIGIAPDDHDAVFEEFRQVGTADKKAEGTGLGLALCRKFVELHGGRIWVRSQKGTGSTFTFTLPLGQ